jgi:hypothetical protein
MATPNYSFEKRKRELAKKAAKEAKRLRKDNKPVVTDTPETIEESNSGPAEETAL